MFGPDGPIPKAARRDGLVLPGRQPGPAPVRRRGAGAPRAPLRRQPRLRRPGGRRAAPGPRGRRGCGTARSSSWPRTTARSSTSTASSATTCTVYEPERPHPPDRALSPGRGRRRGPGGRSSWTCSTWRRRSPTSSACARTRGSDREFQGRSLLPVIAGAAARPAVLSRTVWDRPRYALRDGRFTYLYDTRTGEERLYDSEVDPGRPATSATEHPLRIALLPAGPVTTGCSARARGTGGGRGCRAESGAVREPQVARVRGGECQ